VGEADALLASLVVVDLDPPVINITGNTSVVVMQLGTYEELGATAQDAIDGGVPVTTYGLEAISTANYTLPGKPHIIVYSSEDAAGNVANVTRTVEVTRCVSLLRSHRDTTLASPVHASVASPPRGVSSHLAARCCMKTEQFHVRAQLHPRLHRIPVALECSSVQQAPRSWGNKKYNSIS
jgi:hypothetical protein